MRYRLLTSLAVLSFTILGCSKNDEEQTTIFEGAILLSGTNQSFEGLKIVIYGHNNCEILGCDRTVRRVVNVNPNGLFSIQHTSSEDRWYTLDVWGETKLGIMTECTPDCNSLNPGKTYSNLSLYVERQ